jgi:hypothetical protein
MRFKKTGKCSVSVEEEVILLKPKYQAILSLIGHFQHNKKNIQRAQLIQALVKNAEPNQGKACPESNEKKQVKKLRNHWYHHISKQKVQPVDAIETLGPESINQLHTLEEVAPKVMFNSIANLDKTVARLRKLGLITNQYAKGYPQIILTEKGRMFFYSFVYSGLIFKTISDLINRFH